MTIAKYTIQNSDGDVFGIHDLPEEAGFTPDQWVDGLWGELTSAIGEGVSIRFSVINVGGEDVDRVLIDIGTSCALEETRLAAVHDTIARLGSIATPDPAA